jgi:uncharacterized surface protein with fasciclin (FAS1) repeats
VLTNNGLMHVVDTVLQLPPMDNNTLLENLMFDPNVYTLSSLLQDPAYNDIATVLGQPGLTLIAPDNQAFENFDAAVSPDFIEVTLSYHVINETVVSGDLSVGTYVFETALSNSLYVNLGEDEEYQRLEIMVTEDETGRQILVNKAHLVTTDVPSVTGSVAHVASQVLAVPKGVFSVAEANGLETFMLAVETANLVEQVEQTPGWTILIPNDEAWASFLSRNDFDDLDSIGENELASELQGHVIPSLMYSPDFTDGSTLTMVDGTEWDVTVSGNNVLRVDGHRVITTNLFTKTGVIHVLDGVLGEPSGNSAGHLTLAEILIIVFVVLLCCFVLYKAYQKYKQPEQSAVALQSGLLDDVADAPYTALGSDDI